VRFQLDIDTDSLGASEVAALLTQLAALENALSARLLAVSSAHPPQAQQPECAPRVDRERLLTVPQAASTLGFTRSYTYYLVRSQQLRAVHHGKYWRIRPAALEEFIGEHEITGGAHERSVARIKALSRRGNGPGGK
jgi:excisionase family DNA binding protein